MTLDVAICSIPLGNVKAKIKQIVNAGIEMDKNRKQTIRLTGKFRTYLNISFLLGILLMLINIWIYTISSAAGLVLSIFVIFYMLISCISLFKNKPYIVNDLIDFATKYGQIQKELLKELDVPYVITDENGKIIWMNYEFENLVNNDKANRKSIMAVVPSITKEMLPIEVAETESTIEFNDNTFKVIMKKVPLTELVEDAESLEADEYVGFLIAIYLYDVTALKIALMENDNQSLAICMIYLDNYEEALESVEEVRRSLLIALIDRKVNKYISSIDGLCKKIEKDKYFIVLRKEAVKRLQELRFDLLEDVKTVNIGNEMSVTLSIGVGLDGLSYAQNYEFSRTAIDVALGRGGDQAVVKTPDSLVYYGGKSQQVEKNTRVKARVKAHALREIITAKDRVLVMGHRLPDADSFGAAVGICKAATALERKSHVVLNDVTTSLQPLKALFDKSPDYANDMFVTSQQAMELAGPNTVLVVVDVNKPSITECPELLKICKSIVVLDHHRQGQEVIENATLSYVEPYASSACEMVAEILQYIGEVKINSIESDSLYSGIMIDTNNFTNKTGVRTFEAAAFLRRNGADVTRVRKLFREDANEYRAKADIVSQAEVYRNDFAISVFYGGNIASPTIIGAQAANELLNIKGVKASFVFTVYQNMTYLSARSIDEINVQIIAEKMGGGGHMNVAGAQFETTDPEEVKRNLYQVLDTMLEEGEI